MESQYQHVVPTQLPPVFFDHTPSIVAMASQKSFAEDGWSDVENGCVGFRSFVYGSWILMALFLISVGITISVSIRSAGPSPIVAPNSTLYSPTGVSGAEYFQLFSDGPRFINMSTIPLTPSLGSLGTTLFPAGVASSCSVRPRLLGDISITTQVLAVTLNPVTETLMSYDVSDGGAKIISLRLMCTLSLFVIAAAHIIACSIPAMMGGKWNHGVVENILRILLLVSFTMMEFFGILVTINLFGPPNEQIQVLWCSVGLGFPVGLAIMLKCGQKYRQLCAKSMTNTADADGSETPMSTSIRRLLIVSSIVHFSIQVVIVTVFLTWTYNWGINGILEDWKPLYTPGLGSLACAAVWILVVGLLVVSLLTTSWLEIDVVSLSDNFRPENLRTASKFFWIGLDETQVLIFFTADMLICLTVFIFSVVIFFATRVPDNLAC